MTETLWRHRQQRVIGISLAATAMILLVAAARSNDRIQLFPRLRNGGSLGYQTHARLSRYVKTKSNVATMYEPKPLQADVAMNLQVAVEDYHVLDHRPMLAATTELLPERLPEDASGKPAKSPKVKFVIGGNGEVARADGLDDLDSGQRLAWRFWVAQFAFGWTLPASGVRPGEKWKAEEVEQTPTPIAKLVWEREITYVQDEKCPIVAGEQCAVFLVNAHLKQRSNPADTTPEDYKLHQLKTSGTANGTNQTMLYISRNTGLLVRASEEVRQSLDVTIAKPDAGNQVQYMLDVTSHFETELIPPGKS